MLVEAVQDADELMAEYNAQIRQKEELEAQHTANLASNRILRQNFSTMDKVQPPISSHSVQ